MGGVDDYDDLYVITLNYYVSVDDKLIGTLIVSLLFPRVVFINYTNSYLPYQRSLQNLRNKVISAFLLFLINNS